MTAHTDRRSRLPLALTAVLCLLLTGALAAAAATEASSVTLNLQGGYANRQLTACSLKHHYTYFHARNTITMKGSVAPTPASSSSARSGQAMPPATRTAHSRPPTGHPGAGSCSLAPTTTAPPRPHEATNSTSASVD
jgi:ABC-type phosphate transport system substrate-binding protein